ncbi:MAG: hypothetical protein WBP87_02490, partial [Candidatus Sulfotelmatobacter sp.]
AAESARYTVNSLETRMNCGSLFVGARGGTMEASHPDIAVAQNGGREAAKGEPKANLLAHPIPWEARLTSRQSYQRALSNRGH